MNWNEKHRKIVNFFKKKEWRNLDKSEWLIVVLVGVLLLVIAIPTGDNKGNGSMVTKEKSTEIVGKISENTSGGDEKEQKESTETIADGISIQQYENQYISQLEAELEEMLTHMDGVGKVKVMITLKDSGEKVVEKDISDTSEITEETDSAGGTRSTTQLQSGEETVYDSDENKTPFVSKELEPEVEGVLILAEGGDNTKVKQNISDAVLALFPIEAHKIKVVKMSVTEGIN